MYGVNSDPGSFRHAINKNVKPCIWMHFLLWVGYVRPAFSLKPNDV
jgi:hypothetical protein